MPVPVLSSLELLLCIQEGETTFAVSDFHTIQQAAAFEQLSDELLELRKCGWVTFPDPLPSGRAGYTRYQRFEAVTLTAAGAQALAESAAEALRVIERHEASRTH